MASRWVLLGSVALPLAFAACSSSDHELGDAPSGVGTGNKSGKGGSGGDASGGTGGDPAHRRHRKTAAQREPGHRKRNRRRTGYRRHRKRDRRRSGNRWHRKRTGGGPRRAAPATLRGGAGNGGTAGTERRHSAGSGTGGSAAYPPLWRNYRRGLPEQLHLRRRSARHLQSPSRRRLRRRVHGAMRRIRGVRLLRGRVHRQSARRLRSRTRWRRLRRNLYLPLRFPGKPQLRFDRGVRGQSLRPLQPRRWASTAAASACRAELGHRSPHPGRARVRPTDAPASWRASLVRRCRPRSSRGRLGSA